MLTLTRTKFEPLGTLPVPGDLIHYTGENRVIEQEFRVSELKNHFLGAPVCADVLHVHFVQLTSDEDLALCLKHKCAYIGPLVPLKNSIFEDKNPKWRVQKRKPLKRRTVKNTSADPYLDEQDEQSFQSN